MNIVLPSITTETHTHKYNTQNCKKA